MKKYVMPLLIAATVFCVTLFCQRFTILRQEGLGLFLNTPDFYRDLLFDPFPLSNLIGSFLVQFYSNMYVGCAIVALMVVLVFVLVRGILRRFGLKIDAVAALGAAAAWFFLARAANPSMGVAIILCTTAFYALVCIVLRRKAEKAPLKSWLDICAGIAVLVAASLTIALSPSNRDGEKWSRIEFAAEQGEWDFLLKVATPEEAKKDMSVVPYALLALNAQGRLADEIGTYPVMEHYGLDYGDEVSYKRALFDAVLYSNLGCHNEAIHRTHQCGDFLPHCTSFRTLRMLVKENYALGDSLMVVKYCDVLDRSTLHHEFTSYFRNNPCPQRVPNTSRESAVTPLIISKYPMDTMLQLGRAGINSGMAMERYYAYYKLKEYFNNHNN